MLVYTDTVPARAWLHPPGGCFAARKVSHCWPSYQVLSRRRSQASLMTGQFIGPLFLTYNRGAASVSLRKAESVRGVPFRKLGERVVLRGQTPGGGARGAWEVPQRLGGGHADEFLITATRNCDLAAPLNVLSHGQGRASLFFQCASTLIPPARLGCGVRGSLLTLFPFPPIFKNQRQISLPRTSLSPARRRAVPSLHPVFFFQLRPLATCVLDLLTVWSDFSVHLGHLQRIPLEGFDPRIR